MSEFYGSIVENLKQEAKHLNIKLLACRNRDDMNGYISTLRSLKDTLELIKKYDWQLIYSEYGVIKSDKNADRGKRDNFVTEIAVWEQNHEGQIRNHKVWTTNIPYGKGISIKYENGVTACHVTNGNLCINGEVTWNK